MDECEKHNSNTICARTEFDHIIVPYVGIIYGFSLTFYNIHNCIAIFLNLLCCLNICSKNKDNSNISIEMNKLDKKNNIINI